MISSLKRLVPNAIKKRYHSIMLQLKLQKINKAQNQKKEDLRRKKSVDIAFLLIHDSVWKYEALYRMLEKDIKFNPIIVIIPLVRDGNGVKEVYDQTLEYFSNGNYNILPTYDSQSNHWIDIESKVNLDVIFFTNPHKLTFEKYYINHFSHCLTCYVPYAFVVIGLIDMHYNQFFHKALWRHFVETKIHLAYAQRYLEPDGINVRVSGFPGLDEIFSKNYHPKNPWKQYSANNVQRIIWAPHHSINGQGAGLDYSSFMEYSDIMIELLVNRDDLQMAFKPHPLLKEKLYNDSNWGKTKTDKYYSMWDTLENGQLEEGPYIELFYHSDAMIMDSASFIAEYQYFIKPLLFTKSDADVVQRFNSFGQMLFGIIYQSSNIQDTISFIDTVVVDKNDPLREKRESFFNEEIQPSNGKLASQNVYNELVKELC